MPRYDTELSDRVDRYLTRLRPDVMGTADGLAYLVEEAERRGDLRPGMTIIEGTTGNTGIATACAAG